MSKITFRADDELIRQLEEFDASKSEVMREALREYLDEAEKHGVNGVESDENDRDEGSITGGSIDEIIADRVDEIITDRLESAYTPREPRDVNVNISLDGDSSSVSSSPEDERKTPTVEPDDASDKSDQECKQCGETLSPSSVYCPNCGEKTSHRAFCECGDELRSDWAFCPSCGRRTPAADVLKDP